MISVVLLITHGRPLRFPAVPVDLVLIAKLALGIVLIAIAAVEWHRRDRPHTQPAWLARLDTMSPWTAAVIAAIAQPWTLVAAGAVTITQARLSSVGDWFALALFCLLSTSSFLVLELYSVLAPTASTRLAALRTWLDDHGSQVLIVVCLVVGCWLTGRSGYLLATGRH